jgi:hypothetical protein
MKTKPQNTRNRRFHSAYGAIYEGLRARLFVRGPHGHEGGWVDDGGRKRARKLARDMARHKDRMERATT